MPVSLDDSGHVNYSDDIGRFDQLLSKSQGVLGFSVMPILEEDITPHQIYFSAEILSLVKCPSDFLF